MPSNDEIAVVFQQLTLGQTELLQKVKGIQTDMTDVKQEISGVKQELHSCKVSVTKHDETLSQLQRLTVIQAKEAKPLP